MQLYIQTPLYNHNKYIPHLLEHCVLFSSNREELFMYFGDVEAGTTYGCTDFEFYAPLSLSHLLQKICQPILKETFLIQKKHLAYELKNATFSQKLREKFMQTIAQNPQICANQVQKGNTLEILNAYQKQRYQEQYMIFVGEDENVDLHFGKGKQLKKLTGKRNIKSFAKIDVQYQKTTYEVLFCKYHTASDFLLLDFLEGLISNRKFRKTTQQQQPFEDTIDITLSDTYAFLSSEEFQSFRDVDNDFYHFFKQRYLTELAFNRWRGFISRIALYTGEYASIEEHQRFIQHLEYIDISNVLSLLSKPLV